jgi:hypothetical protein
LIKYLNTRFVESIPLKVLFLKKLINPGTPVKTFAEYSSTVATNKDDQKLDIKLSETVLSKEGRDFLFNKLLNTDPTKRLNIHEKNDYLGLDPATPKPKFSLISRSSSAITSITTKTVNKNDI